MISQIYTDGGVVAKNPSTIGGSWAWVALCELQKIVAFERGLITPTAIELPTVSNNVAELFAAMKALEAYPDFNGSLYTDSQVTLFRLTTGQRFNGIPQWMRERVLDLRRYRKYRVVLVRGHPTKEQLESGWSGGLPVSKWNVFCDQQCRKVAKKYGCKAS